VVANKVGARAKPEFPVGGWARVVVGDKRYRDRVGRIVSSESPFVELKFKGSVGTYSFDRSCVRIESAPQEPVVWQSGPDIGRPPAQPAADGPIELREGGFAKVIAGDKRFQGRIGKVTSIAPPYIELKFKGSIGRYSFQRSCVTPDAGRSW
jgi:hypothetical protein